MKKTLVYIFAITLFVIGTLLELTNLPGSGLSFAISFILLIIYAIAIYIKRDDSQLKKIFYVAICIVLPAISYSLLQNIDFTDMLIVTSIIVLMTILITGFVRFKKRKQLLDK